MLFRAPTGEQSQAQIEAFEDTWHWNETAERAFDEVIHSGNPDAANMLRAVRSFLGENDMMAYLAMMAVDPFCGSAGPRFTPRRNSTAESDDKVAAELAIELDSWRKRRNQLVHAAVRSYPMTPPKFRPPEFWHEAKGVAKEGVSLSRRLLRWYRGRLRAIKATVPVDPSI